MVLAVQSALRARSLRFGNGSATPPELVPTIKSQTIFNETLEQATLPVLVKFEKKNCPECLETQPMVDNLAKLNPDKVKVVKALMWDETNPDNRSMKKLAFQYAIKTAPVFILFEKGKELLRGLGKAGLKQVAENRGYAYTDDLAKLPPPYQPAGAVLTVLYDGECTICKGTAEKLKTLDKNNRLALIPLQSPLVRDKYPALKLVELRKSIHVVDKDGKVFKGAEAFQEMGRIIQPQSLLGASMKVFSWLSKIPGVLPVTDFFYLEFSKRRFMFEAKKADCKSCTLEE
jgi:predicted DCC family thiol-disulfide oxidoreductase YuxK